MTLRLHVRSGTRITAHKGVIRQSVGWQTSSHRSWSGNRVGQRGYACPQCALFIQAITHWACGPSLYHRRAAVCPQQAEGGVGGDGMLWQNKKLAKGSQHGPPKLFSHPPDATTIHKYYPPVQLAHQTGRMGERTTQQAKQHTRASNTHQLWRRLKHKPSTNPHSSEKHQR